MICLKGPRRMMRDKVPIATDFWSTTMSFANVMVYVDPQQQEEGQIRVAESIAKRFDGSVIGVSAFAIEPPFVAEGLIIEETSQ